MRKMTLSQRGFAWTCAVLLAASAVGAPSVHAASTRSNAALLSEQLPSGVTLARANVKQTADAVHAAVAKRHEDAAEIVRIAIVARTPKRGQGELPCRVVKEIMNAAMTSAPERAREIAEMGISLAPDCADDINAALRNPAYGTGTGSQTAQGAVPGSAEGGLGGDGGGDFGGGFGPGFPGAPGFSGSAPSGAAVTVPLPTPASTPVTNVTNG